MKVLAIIAEYNPMHNGHIYQITQAKKLINPDYCIAIISGNFTQRGELSILSKWDKASIAVTCGIDLVIELPTLFACNNSEYFAKGSIEILNRLGVVTHLAFGSESGNLNMLSEIADLLTTRELEISAKIKKFSKSGISHFEARKSAIEHFAGREYANLMLNSNDILALEYLKHLKSTKSHIKPLAIKREGSEFNSFKITAETFISATCIRNFLSQPENFNTLKKIEGFVPKATLNALKSVSFEQLQKMDERYFTALGAIILNSNSNLVDIFSITEGLENRIYRYFLESTSLQELREKLFSKRYAKSRINRILSHILLNITKKDVAYIDEQSPYYARILAFNAQKSGLLKEVKKTKTDDLPIITNLSKDINSPVLKNNPILKFDIKASNIYALLCANSLYYSSDLVNSPRIY
ncbi:MAG: nucleotidyltransferase [Eubacteriales bacterium]